MATASPALSSNGHTATSLPVARSLTLISRAYSQPGLRSCGISNDTLARSPGPRSGSGNSASAITRPSSRSRATAAYSLSLRSRQRLSTSKLSSGIIVCQPEARSGRRTRTGAYACFTSYATGFHTRSERTMPLLVMKGGTPLVRQSSTQLSPKSPP